MSDWMSKLFARSPFGPFQDHMRKVQECIDLLPELAKQMKEGDGAAVLEVAKRISQLEHDADEIKNQIRDNLPNTLFLPVGRRDLLDVLSAQDAIADEAEDVAVVATMRTLRPDDQLFQLLSKLVDQVMETARMAGRIVEELDELVESSFSDKEMARVHAEINSLGRLEHEADKTQDQITRRVYELGEDWPAPDFFAWMKVIQTFSDVANAAERMGNRLRTFVTR